MNKNTQAAQAVIVGAALLLHSSAWAADEDAASKQAYEQRAALAKKIRKMREMRRMLPLSPPAGLSGAFAFPEKGQFVTGIGFRHIEKSGLLQGSDSISTAEAAASAPNYFAGQPGQPPTLRVIPTKAEGNVIYPFINYAISKELAVVASLPLIRKKTTLETFNPPGTASIGTTDVTSSGIGDAKIGVLFKAYNAPDRKHNLLVDAILSVPTGSLTEEDSKLTPAGTYQTSRLAYGMQLGSGTWDAIVGVSYWGKSGQWGWGAQFLGTYRLESENAEGWSYGDKQSVTGWVSYAASPTVVTSLRVKKTSEDSIEGLDPQIYGPGLGANPDNYGGDRTVMGLGLNWMYAPARNISFEYLAPIDEDLNGVQLEHDSTLAISWRNAFF